MIAASTRPWMSSEATGCQMNAGLSVLSLVRAGLVPPVNMSTRFGIATARATALVTPLHGSPMIAWTLLMLTSFWAASTPACGLPWLSWESDSTTLTSGRLSFLSVSSMWSIPIFAAWFQACPEIAGSPVRPERMPYFSVNAGFPPWPEAGCPATSSAPIATSGRAIQMRFVMYVLLSVDRMEIVCAAIGTGGRPATGRRAP